MKKLLFLLTVCISVSGYAQDPDYRLVSDLPQVFSPNSAELGKYGRIPVNYFNGLPSITIPLTELKARGYTLPIYLSYHASGNKPDQHPGWVGLGWSLHAGGCINRIVNGMKDEMCQSEYHKTHQTGPLWDPGYYYFRDYVQNRDWLTDVDEASLRNAFDYTPDEFQVCLDDIQASFYLTEDGGIKIVSKSAADFKVDIHMSNGEHNPILMYPGFSLTDGFGTADRYDYFDRITLTNSDGTVYVFGGSDDAIEYSMPLMKMSQIDVETGDVIPTNSWFCLATANTWLLTRIERPDGEVITFSYAKDGTPIVRQDAHFSKSIRTPNGNYSFSSLVDTEEKLNISFSLIHPSYLKSIRCSTDSLTFSRDRTIELKYATTHDELKKRAGDYLLITNGVPHHTYAEMKAEDYYMRLSGISGPNRDIRLSHSSDTLRRLTLEQVSFCVGEDTSEHKYSFNYDTERLPSYHARQSDLWGFYNGIDYSSTHYHIMEQARKHVIPTKAKAEILTAIHYPTGGWTEFEYEGHDYSKEVKQVEVSLVDYDRTFSAGGLRIKEIRDYSVSDKPEIRTFDYRSSSGQSSGILAGTPSLLESGPVSWTYSMNGLKYCSEATWIEEGNYEVFSENPIRPLSVTDGNHVTYSQVKETLPDGSSTVYKYSNHDYPHCCDTRASWRISYMNAHLLFNSFNSRELFRGHLLHKEDYSASDQLIRDEMNEYAIDSTQFVKAIVFDEECNGCLRRYSYQKFFSAFPCLERRTVSLYPDDGGEPIVETTEYSYNSHRQVTRVVRRVGNECEETRMTYSGDMPNKSLFKEMQAAGIFDRPVERTVLRGTPIISSSLITYRKSSGQFVPDKYYESRLGSPIPSNNSLQWKPYNGEFTRIQQSVYGAPRMTFESYDAHGNIVCATDEGGRCSRYHWDPKGWNPEASFSGTLKSEDTASREIDFRNCGSEEYSIEFDADFTGNYSFFLSWPNFVDYSICGYLDGEPVFVYRKVSGTGGGRTPRRGLRSTPETDTNPDLGMIPTTELCQGTVTAGHHVLRVVRMEDQEQVGGSERMILSGTGTITYPAYNTEQHANYQGTWYYSFEADGNVEMNQGFHSDNAWRGSKTFSQTIPSGVPYTIDWMEHEDGKWTYHSAPFTGRKVLGGRYTMIDNVRIYPSELTATNWTWTATGELRSVTDGAGMTTSYAYDGMGRLATISDTDGKMVSSYEYHYTQPSAATPDSYVKTLQYTNADGASATETISYHDGLGRPWQTISVAAGKTDSGTPMNLCERTDYDASGRPYKTWLPFRTADVAPRTEAPSSDPIYSGETEPFSYVEYDGSPLDRPRAEFGPGAAWHANGKAVRYGYYTNGSSQLTSVRRYRIVSACDTTVTVTRSGMIPSATLAVKSVQDEDGLTLLTFTDLYGNTVLERRHPASGEGDLDTYYVYDDMGRLAAVIPPVLSKKTSISSADLDRYAYLYTYDANGNCTAKKLPGCGWTRYIYDKANRPVFSQSAEDRRMGRWMFSFQDIHGRSCVSGYCEDDRETLEAMVPASNVIAARQENAVGPYKGYAVSGLSLTDPVVLSVSYYDDYSFITSQIPSWERSRMNYAAEYGLTKWDCVRGLQTGSAERILGDGGVTNSFRWNVCYYDRKGNLIQTRTTRMDGGVDVATTDATFTGKPAKVHMIHAQGLPEKLDEFYEYTYDNWDRPLTVKHRMDEQADSTVLSNITYDGIGRVKSDGRTSYTYNVRSWTKNITGPGLSETMSYEDGGQWGGNISGITWSSGPGSEAFSDTYGYDGLSRLSSSTRTLTSAPARRYINDYAYDEHGNLVRSLFREHLPGGIVSATLKAFTHDGNRLVFGTVTTCTVTTGTNSQLSAYAYDWNGRPILLEDEGLIEGLTESRENSQQSSYAYDRNGRLTLSEDEGLTEIRYNAVGYPSFVGMGDNGYVYNLYTAGGTRLRSRRMDADGVTTAMDYEGNEVIENGQRRMLLFDGGYVDFSGSEPRYLWYTKDHLGSVRAVSDVAGIVFSAYAYGPYGEDFAGEEEAESGQVDPDPLTINGMNPNLENMPIYPGGGAVQSPVSSMSIPGAESEFEEEDALEEPPVIYSAPAAPTWQPYRFSGKESLTRVGLPLYDFGARMYSPSNTRWMTIDPLAEKYYHISPYVYCAGNPVNLVDPDGREWDVVNGVVTIYLNFTNSAGLTDEQLMQYKNAVISLFNSTISSASSGSLSGNVVFYENNPDLVQTVDFGTFGDNSFGGSTSYMSSFINVNDKDGNMGSPESIAQTTVHELFHTVRLHHPFEYTQSADTELISLGANSFTTTENTNPNIVNNIMSYSNISINGEKGTNMVYLTPGQLEHIMREIQLQKQGYGFLGRGKTFKEYEKYWNEWPGEPVRKSN